MTEIQVLIGLPTSQPRPCTQGKPKGWFESLKSGMISYPVKKLFYCSSVWGNTSKRNLHKLQLVQNFAARVVLGLRKFEHVKHSAVHNRNTRGYNDFVVPRCRLSMGQRAFYICFPREWNGLSENIKNKEIDIFKRTLLIICSIRSNFGYKLLWMILNIFWI